MRGRKNPKCLLAVYQKNDQIDYSKKDIMNLPQIFIFHGNDFIDQYEASELYKQNEMI